MPKCDIKRFNFQGLHMVRECHIEDNYETLIELITTLWVKDKIKQASMSSQQGATSVGFLVQNVRLTHALVAD